MARPKKTKDPEYTLNIFRAQDPKSLQDGWVFLVRTVKEFVSFNYEILLTSEVTKNAITLKITGIHAPLLVMPGIGPAKGSVFLRELQGPYALTVKKLNKEVNDFKIVLRNGRAEIRNIPAQPFITIQTEALPLD